MNTRDQLRAIVLATIMIVSMVAAGATAVSAQPSPDTDELSGPDLKEGLSSPDISNTADRSATESKANETDRSGNAEYEAENGFTHSDTEKGLTHSDAEVSSSLTNANDERIVLISVERNLDSSVYQQQTNIGDTLRQDSAETLEPVATELTSLTGVTVRNQFWAGNIITATVDFGEHDVADITSIENVRYVSENIEFERPTPTPVSSSADVSPEQTNVTYGLEQINVPQFDEEFDGMGEGATVMIGDDGITTPEDPHPDLEFALEAIVENGTVEEGTLVGGAEEAHGEHTAGTATGAADPAGDVPRYGVAPNADLLMADVFAGGATVEDIIASMEWAADNDADVASFSLGLPNQQGLSTFVNLYVGVIRDVKASGTLPVVSAGNAGGTGNVGGDNGGPVSSPATNFNSVAVGASNDAGEIASFSSGALINDQSIEIADELPATFPSQYVQPDVSAPGVGVLSSGPLGTPVEDPAANYSLSSGTSMAAPHYAGAVALLQSATDEDLPPTVIEAALAETAQKPDTDELELNGRDIRFGTGIIDVYAAAQALEQRQTIDGTVTDAAGDPVVGATVETADGALTATDEAGDYILETTNDPATVTADAFGFSSDTATVGSTTEATANFSLTESVDAILLDGQPTLLQPGESFDISVEVANLEGLTVELTNNSGVDPSDVTVSVGGDELTLGEEFTFDDPVEGEVTLTVSTTANASGQLGLAHTFAGAGEQVSVVTGPTNISNQEPFFELSDLQQPDELGVDDSIVGNVTVTNTGNVTGSGEVLYRTNIDGADPSAGAIFIEAVDVGPLAPGESTTVEDDLLTFEDINGALGTSFGPGDEVVTGFQSGDNLNPNGGPEPEVDDELSAPIEIVDIPEPFFEVSELSAPAEADSGDTINVSATITNTGDGPGEQRVEFVFDGTIVDTKTVNLDTGDTETVEFTDIELPNEDGVSQHGVFTNDDSAQALITVGDVGRPASVTIVHDSPEFAPEMADLLDRGLALADQPATVDIVTSQDVTDTVIDNTDVFLFYSLDDDSASSVIPAVENSSLTKAVYVEQFADANAIAQRSEVTGDPDESLADFDVGGGVDVNFNIEQDHPLFDGVGAAGDSVLIHRAGDGDRAFFEGADGDTLATVGAGGEVNGPVATVDPDSGSILLGTIAPNTFEPTSNLFSDNAAHILGNAISVGVNDIPEQVVSDVSIDADFIGTVADDEEITVEASGVVSGGELVDGEQITFTVGDKPVTTATVTSGSATATFNPAILDSEAGQTLEVSVEGFPVSNGATVDTVDEVRGLDEGFNLLSVPQAAELSAEDISSINVWNSQDGTYDTVTESTFDDPADLHNALYVSAESSDARLGFTFAGDVPAAGTAVLDEGWNFVGSNFKIDSVEAGDQRTLSEDLLEVDESTLSVFASDFSQQLDGDAPIGAFDAYWVFVSDDPRERAIISPAYDGDTREQDVLEAGDGNFSVTDVSSEAVDADQLQTDDILGTGETAVLVNATVENVGDRIDTQFVDLEVDSNQNGTYERVDRTGLELSAGIGENSATVTLAYLTDATDPDGVDLRVVTSDTQDEDEQALGNGTLTVSDQALTLDDEFIIDEIDFGGDGTLQVVDNSTGDVIGSMSVSDVSETAFPVPVDTPVAGNVTVELVAGDSVQADRNVTLNEPTIDVSNEAPPFAFENETIDVPVTVTNNALVAETGVDVTLSARGETFTETVNLTSGERQTVTLPLDTTAFGLELGDTLEHTAAAGDGSDTETLEIAEADASFNDQALGQTSDGGPAVVVEDVTADAGQFVVVTDTSSDLTEIGARELDERVLEEDIVVPLDGDLVEPGEHIAHVTEDPDLLEQPGSGDEPFVNDNATVFDGSVTIDDQQFEDSTSQVTVDASDLQPAGASDYKIVVHNQTGVAPGGVGPPIGFSANLTGAETNVTIPLTETLNTTTDVLTMLHFPGNPTGPPIPTLNGTDFGIGDNQAGTVTDTATAEIVTGQVSITDSPDAVERGDNLSGQVAAEIIADEVTTSTASIEATLVFEGIDGEPEQVLGTETVDLGVGGSETVTFTGLDPIQGNATAVDSVSANLRVETSNDADVNTTSLTNPVQKAINFADANNIDTVEVEPGTYEESVTISDDGLTLEGPNAGTPADESRNNEATISGTVEIVGASGVTVDGFKIAEGSSQLTSGVSIQPGSSGADGITVTNSIIENMSAAGGGGTNDFTFGVLSFGGNLSDVTITDSRIANIGNPGVTQGVAVSLQSLTGTTAGTGATVERNTIRNISSLDSTRVGTGVALRSNFNGNDSAAVVAGNSFAGLGIAVSHPQGDTATVDPTDLATVVVDDPGSTNQQRIFTLTVQDAVTAAESGDTVEVGPGTFEESVTVDVPSVTVESAASVTPTVVGQSSNAVTIGADDVTVSGLDIQNPTGSGDGNTSVNAVGVKVDPANTNVTIENNSIGPVGTAVNTNVIGVYVERDADDVTVTNNTLSTLDGTVDDEDRTQAILLIAQEGGNVGSITGATIFNNTITNVTDTRSVKAIEFNGNISGSIAENDISDLDTDGPAGTGFTQAIALGQGSNANTGPSDVLIENNTVSNLEPGTPADFAAPSHIILSAADDVSTIDITDNEFSALADDELFVLDRATGDFDLQGALGANTFAPSAVQVTDGSDRALVPETGVDVVNVDQNTGFDQIQPAVDGANAGDTIEAKAGTFNESQLLVNVPGLTIEGSGNTVIDNTAGGGATVRTIATDITITNLTVTNSGGGNGFDIPTTQNASGLQLDDVTISDTSIAFFNDLTTNGGPNDDVEQDFSNVVFSDVTIENSERKGIYTEALSDAVFDNVTIDGVTSDSYGFNTGIDINLKYDDYENITISDTTVANVSEGSPSDPSFSAAIAVKARDDPTSYSTNPATLDDVTINGVTIKDSFNGLRIGEPGVNYSNAPEGPSNVTITSSTFRNVSANGYYVEDVPGDLDLNAILTSQSNTFDPSAEVSGNQIVAT